MRRRPKCSPRIETLQESLKKAERALSEAQKKLALGGSAGAAAPAAETVNGTAFVGRAVEGVAAKDLRGLVDAEKRKLGSGVIALVLKGEDGKGTVAIGVSEDLTAKFSAADLIKHATAALGGQGGGGRPDMAQGGGPDGSKAAEAIAAVRARALVRRPAGRRCARRRRAWSAAAPGTRPSARRCGRGRRRRRCSPARRPPPPRGRQAPMHRGIR